MTTDPQVAAEALADGRLAALPTETVFGLGAHASDAHAVARVYAAKGRPADHPLIVHVRDAEAAWRWGTGVPAYAEVLAERFWPGPLTLVIPRATRAGDFITGGQDTVAVRVPSHPATRAVLDALGGILSDPGAGIAAPSANRFGRVSPTTAAHVIDELGSVLHDDDVVLDGAASDVGVESTIVDCTGPVPVILRPGAVTARDITDVTGLELAERSEVRAPGTLASHYAPHARVEIVAPGDLASVHDHFARTGLLAMVEVETPEGLVRLSAPATADDYARVLYSALREADALQLQRILAIPPSSEGIGAAVIDRLQRAATR